MAKSAKRLLDNPEQSKRFIEAAKKAEADETEEGAQRAFKKIVVNIGTKPSSIKKSD